MDKYEAIGLSIVEGNTAEEVLKSWNKNMPMPLPNIEMFMRNLSGILKEVGIDIRIDSYEHALEDLLANGILVKK